MPSSLGDIPPDSCFGSIFEEKMANEIGKLSKLITYVSRSLELENVLADLPDETIPDDFLGPPDDRAFRMVSILNTANAYISSLSPENSLNIRLFVVRYFPRFLMRYQALRFPQILDNVSSSLPTKSDLSRFPEVVNETGLFLPVSAILRLIAVSLIDEESKEELIRAGNVKAIVSHMVDDPLNPFQRECAIFVIKVFTTGFERGQAAIGEFMGSGYRS